MTDLRILPYNTQGLHGIENRTDILEYSKDKKKAIFIAYKTHISQKTMKLNIIDQWGNSNYIFSNYKSNSRGVSILFEKGY